MMSFKRIYLRASLL